MTYPRSHNPSRVERIRSSVFDSSLYQDASLIPFKKEKGSFTTTSTLMIGKMSWNHSLAGIPCGSQRAGREQPLTFLTSYLMASLTRLREALCLCVSADSADSRSPFRMASTSSESRHRSSTPTTKSLHCMDSFR